MDEEDPAIQVMIEALWISVYTACIRRESGTATAKLTANVAVKDYEKTFLEDVE